MRVAQWDYSWPRSRGPGTTLWGRQQARNRGKWQRDQRYACRIVHSYDSTIAKSLTRQKFFQLSGNVVDIRCVHMGKNIPCTKISPVNKRYPSTRENFSPHWTQWNFSYYFHNMQDEISLVNLSKCFLANQDNFSPYEQALRNHRLDMFLPCFSEGLLNVMKLMIFYIILGKLASVPVWHREQFKIWAHHYDADHIKHDGHDATTLWAEQNHHLYNLYPFCSNLNFVHSTDSTYGLG